MDYNMEDTKEDINKVVVMVIMVETQKVIIKQSILMELIYAFIINIFTQ